MDRFNFIIPLYLLDKSTDYFAQSTELNVFTHTWSLGVEEQFYILFPFLIWFSVWTSKEEWCAQPFLIIFVLTIVSLIGFVYLYPINQSAAYFLMPTRFWEMALGCLLFIGVQKRNSIEKSLKCLLISSIIDDRDNVIAISLATVSTIAVVFFQHY